MKAVSLNSSQHLAARGRPGMLDGAAKRMILNQLSALSEGCLVLVDGDERHTFGGVAGADGLRAIITVRNPRFYGDIAFGGSIGAGEAWMQGYWDCDDLVQLVRIMVRNRDLLDGMDSGFAAMARPLRKLAHWINRNTRTGARRNISAHYDLGNEFFGLWLDDSMMYSCALFEREDMTLAEAQRARLDRVCQLLELGPEDHLVEIGTGWGGLALHAATHYGCRVTTTTISTEQYDLAWQRIDAAGMHDRITLLLQDYRDLEGQFDKLISLEMIEAIGHEQFDTYFAKCAELLRPGGRMLIQAITIDDDRFDEYRRSVDFIQRYIFPGSCLPSERAMRESVARTGVLDVSRVDDIGLHYATTLNHWRQNFFDCIDEVRALGYPEEFIRMWTFYFCYCEGGFLERSISDLHFVADRREA